MEEIDKKVRENFNTAFEKSMGEIPEADADDKIDALEE